jgi:RNA polymerase sigma factor (TIGR02999 family)
MSASSAYEITALLHAWNDGDDQALEKLTPLVYEALYRAAKRCISRGQQNQTLQTTALINELYLKVVDLKRVSWQNRAHFFAICAKQMRWILRDLYRAKQYQKRGGGAERVSLDGSAVVSKEVRRDLLAIDESLNVNFASAYLLCAEARSPSHPPQPPALPPASVCLGSARTWRFPTPNKLKWAEEGGTVP